MAECIVGLAVLPPESRDRDPVPGVYRGKVPKMCKYGKCCIPWEVYCGNTAPLFYVNSSSRRCSRVTISTNFQNNASVASLPMDYQPTLN